MSFPPEGGGGSPPVTVTGIWVPVDDTPKTSPYTPVTGDMLLRFDTSGGSINNQMPPSSDFFDLSTGMGTVLEFKKVSTDMNSLIATAASGEDIDGLTSFSISDPLSFFRLIARSNGWDVMGIG